MHKYRTHTCGELRQEHIGQIVKLTGWIHCKRNHGSLLFIDLRDHYGIIQCVIKLDHQITATTNKDIHSTSYTSLQKLSGTPLESVITVVGKIQNRTQQTVNTQLSTGSIELEIQEYQIISLAKDLPLTIGDKYSEYPEETRLTYRYLDLRREQPHQYLNLRCKLISFIRKFMIEQCGFQEFQTPILTTSSPEGARDFLVPSRLNHGKFYALPQAPQIFKQLLMIAGFDKYFQIAPCFRDEDARADRSPGEFYQLDIEMSFVTQDDILSFTENLMKKIFCCFCRSNIPGVKVKVSDDFDLQPFPRLSYQNALSLYGTDKPDLRNPLVITEVTECFKESGLRIFAEPIKYGAIVKAIKVPINLFNQSQSFLQDMNEWAQKKGKKGLGYIQYDQAKKYQGPIGKNLPPLNQQKLEQVLKLNPGDTIFLICDMPAEATTFAGRVRKKLGERLKLIDEKILKFCWVTDMPMYEYDYTLDKIRFCHNPFSMPQGGMQALINQSPLEILAEQYDIVCNGIELSSGAIRNHELDTLIKAFEIAGYNQEDIQQQFSSFFKAFGYGTPPHGGIAPGIDRILMILTNNANIREVIAFPMNQQGQDLMMQAPCFVTPQQLKELGITLLK